MKKKTTGIMTTLKATLVRKRSIRKRWLALILKRTTRDKTREHLLKYHH